jgi:hypothetical protein
VLIQTEVKKFKNIRMRPAIYTAVPTLNKNWLKMRRIFENGRNTSTLLFVLPTVSLQQPLGIGIGKRGFLLPWLPRRRPI